MTDIVRPEDMRIEIKVGQPDVEATITKLKNNRFQYATAGDTQRLIKEIELLRRTPDQTAERTSAMDDPIKIIAEMIHGHRFKSYDGMALAILSALSSAGYKVMAREPTEEMIQAAYLSSCEAAEFSDEWASDNMIVAGLKAAWDAAPA